jgi:PAS domain S-box-containing protein
MFSQGTTAPLSTRPVRPWRDALAVGLAVLAVSLLSISFLERGAREAVHEEMRGDLIRDAQIAEALVDARTLAALQADRDEHSIPFLRSAALLHSVPADCPEIRHLYAMAPSGDSLRYVLDASIDTAGPQAGNRHATLGQAYPDPAPPMLEALRHAIPTAQDEPVTGSRGTFVSGYAPILDSTERAVGIVGIDMAPDSFLLHQETLSTRSLLAQGIMILFSLLTGFFVWQSQDRRRRQEAERQESQERLLLSEEKYRMLFETAGTGIVVFGPDRTIRMINRVCEKLYGWSRTEIEGKVKWTHFIHPEDVATVLEHSARRSAAFDAAPSQYDCRILHNDGGIRHVTFSLAQIPGSDLLVCSLIDRTSLVIAWHELDESRRRYQVIFEVTDTPMLVIDEKNIIQLANKACMDLLSCSRVEVEYHHWAEFIHPDDLPRVAEYEDANTGTAGPWRVTQRVLTKGGEVRVLTFVVSRLPGTDWRIAAGVDLTERIEAEAALQSINTRLDHLVQERTMELETALRSREDFLSSMSHELRTPLQAIEASTEILLENRSGPAPDALQHRHLRTIQRSSSHLLALISDILDLAKSMAGHLQIRACAVDVHALCRDALDLIRPAAGRHGLITRFVGPDQSPCLQADPVRLKQMLVNVLGNAVKFTPPGGEITLEVRTEEPLLHLIVRDTGIGIDIQGQQRIFQPFVQLDNSLARPHAGTGLGLALVQRLAEAHGGSVRLESQPSRGTAVTISLPWEGMTTLSPASEESSVSDVGLPEIRADAPLILLAEDNIDIRESVCEYLEGLGYRMLTADNGREALDRAHANLPDLILMDVQMPYVDGLEATRLLRLDPATRAIPIVAMTALAQESDSHKCLEAGATSYLAKPVRLKDLAATVASLCRRTPAEPG